MSHLNYPQNLANLDNNQMKSPIYWSMPFTKICIGMKYMGHTKWLPIQQSHKSLLSVFTNDTFFRTHMTYDSWVDLMSGVQKYKASACSYQGLNAVLGSSIKLRIGLIGSERSACARIAWFVGIGASIGLSSGYGEFSHPFMPSFGYVLIQWLESYIK